MSKQVVGFFVMFIGFWHGGFSQTSIKDGEKFLKDGDLKKARNILLEHKDDQRARELLGDIASYNKEWDEAIEYYEELVDDYPNSANYHFKAGGAMGMKAMEGSKFQAALMITDIKKSLNKAAELDENHAQVRRALVELYMQLPSIIGGSKSTAETYAKELETINKIDAHLAVVYIYKVEEDKEMMKKEVSTALNTAKNNENLINRNYLYFELGERAASFDLEPELAAKYFQKYIENHDYRDLKSPAWAYYHIAKIKASQNMKEEALKNINLAIAQKFNFPEAEKEKQRILEM